MPKTDEAQFSLPISGINKSTAWSQIPKGFSPDCNNVCSFDLGGRARIGSRPGTSKYFSFQFAGTSGTGGAAKSCQLLHQCSVEVSGARADYIITCFGGYTYRCTPATASAAACIIDGGTPAFSAGRRVEAATLFGVTYFTDGLALKKYTHATTTWANFTASSGSMPATATPRYCRLFAAWRGRLVQAGLDDASPELVFFSKQNDPTNYDYGATPSPDMAVALNSNFRAGQIGQPVTALIPYSEDILLIGCDHAIYKMVGDPADGGTLMPLSEQIGILTQDAWTLVGGVLYFIGADGFYKWSLGSEPENLSRTVWNENFEAMPRVGYYVNLEYDMRRHCIVGTITHNVTTYQTKHFEYSLRTGGFFPFSYPVDSGGDDGAGSGGTGAPTIGPTKTLAYDGSAASTDDNCVLIGGRDGYLRKIDASLVNDDGTAIDSYCWYPLIQPGGATREVLINGVWLTAGEQSSYNATFTLYGGESPYSAKASATESRTLTTSTNGRQSPLGWRMSANSFWIKAANSTVSKGWNTENLTVRMGPSGPLR